MGNTVSDWIQDNPCTSTDNKKKSNILPMPMSEKYPANLDASCNFLVLCSGGFCFDSFSWSENNFAKES